jgi:hypothetical protein
MSDDDNVIRFPSFHRIDIEPDPGMKALGMLGCYILVNRKPIFVADYEEWAKAAIDERHRLIKQYGNDADPHRVDRTMIGDVEVSTVFLPINHNFFGEGPPTLFETMVFGGEHNGYQDRCATWEQAETMHQRTVDMVRKMRVVK